MDRIQINQLSYTYPGASKKALEIEHLELQPQRICGLLGPNGSGKSTLFKILSTQIVEFKGHCCVLGHDLKAGMNNSQLRSSLGVTFQSPSLDSILTVQENLKVQGALYGVSGLELSLRIDELLSLFELTDRRSEPVSTLSGGLARRVELAKTLIHKPTLLLLDEPTTGVDPHVRNKFWEILHRLNQDQKVSMIVSTHLMEEAELCDNLAILNEGQLVEFGRPEELKSKFGFDVIEVRVDGLSEAQEIAQVCKLLSSLLPADSRIKAKGEALRIEVTRGLSIMPMLESHFGPKLRSFQWSRPTLEDIFLSKTGKSLN